MPLMPIHLDVYLSNVTAYYYNCRLYSTQQWMDWMLITRPNPGWLSSWNTRLRWRLKSWSCNAVRDKVWTVWCVAGWKNLSLQVAVLSRCLAPSSATRDARSIRVVMLRWQLHAKHRLLTALPANDSLDHPPALPKPKVFKFIVHNSISQWYIRHSALFNYSISFSCVSYAEARNRYRLDVCPSVTRWYCIKTAEHIVMLSSPHDNPFILVLCVKRSSRNFDGVTPCGATKQRWGLKISQFSTNNSLYLRNGWK